MNERILIIDDEQHIRRMMRLTLEAAGYEVGEAQDGAEALKLYTGSKWDAVVLDQRMPGMDGLETLRRLKELNANVPVVMATAYASIELAVDAMKLGATDFVRKPMTPDVLRNAVTAALTKSSLETRRTEPQPSIQTITMNGFTILDDDETPRLESRHRRFVVISPQSQKHDVLVEIDEEAIAYVERMIGRQLPPKNSFWTEQTRSLLADHLWKEGDVPRTRKLTLSDVSREKLLIAERWKDR